MNEIDYGSRFFYTGGALPPTAPSYISRAADDQLFARLQQRDYCYVLVSRQMGKSSLMVRTLVRLLQADITAVMVDLNSIGDDLTQEQWYYSLTEQLASQLGLSQEIDTFWELSEGKTSLQKWVGSVEQMLRLHSDRSLVIFIDEIDQVRSLPFKTDQFFAAIRSFHNRRAMDANFERLTFCLIGVALPSDLIEDSRITPFNIAERIDLTDFTESQVVALKAGLQREEIQEDALLERVFYWTHGHPYLTQRLCRAIVEDVSIQIAADVDRLCARLFFGAESTAPDDNITLVGTRMLHSDPDIMGLLTLYQRIVQGRVVPYDRANRLINVLMLAGAVCAVGGNLQVRNPIYAHVFDARWIVANMPDAELQLQRQAYRRGAVRALSLASVVVAIMAFLLYHTYRSDRNALNTLRIAQQELYVANMSLAQKAYSEGNIPRVGELLQACSDPKELAVYRGFEWRYLWGQIHQEQHTLAESANHILSVGFSADGRTVVTVDKDATIHRWDSETGNKTATFPHQEGAVSATTISADAEMVGIATLDKRIFLHSAVSGRVLCRFAGFQSGICSMTFSHDGRFLAAGAFDGSVTLWRIADKALVRTMPGKGEGDWCSALAISPNGKTLVTSYAHGAAWIRDIDTGHTLADLSRDSKRILAASFSPDGRALATGDFDGRVLVWDLTHNAPPKAMQGHHNQVKALTFSSDGRILATVSADTTARLWNVASGECLRTLEGHSAPVRSVAFSSDGSRLATGSEDRTTKLWDLSVVYKLRLGAAYPSVSCLGVAPNGQQVAISGAGGYIELRDMATGSLLTTLDQKATILAFAHDGSTLVTADAQGTVVANDLQRRSRRTLYHETKAIWALALAPKGSEAVIGSEKGRIDCIDTRTGQRIRAITTPLASISQLAFSPGGEMLAVIDLGGAGVLIDYLTGQIRFRFTTPGSQCFSVCFAPQTSEMALGFADGTVEVWNILSASKEWSVSGHRGAIFALTFSPDGKNLVSGSDDFKVRIWNVQIGREVGTLEGHPDSILGLNFTPDGSALVSIDQGHHMFRWPAPLLNAIPVLKQ